MTAKKSPEPPQGREVEAGFLIVAAVGLILLCAFGLFRVVVPSILEAHFYGSVFAASVVGFAGVLGLGALAYVFFRRIARLLKS